MVTKIKMDKEVKAPKAAKTPKAIASTQSLSSFVKSICDIMRRVKVERDTRTPPEILDAIAAHGGVGFAAAACADGLICYFFNSYLRIQDGALWLNVV